MGMYQDLARESIVEPVQDMIDSGALRVIKGNKIRAEFTPKRHSPFIQVAHPWDRSCSKWFQIYFQKYGILPRGCMNCWKIVAKPTTLRQLMETHDLQVTLGLPAKAGKEIRTYTSGIYSAFWYAPLKEGFDAALEMWKVINGDLSKRGIEVILKRACTEMEMKFGPSNLWIHGEQQRAREDQLDAVFDIKSFDSTTMPMYYNRIKKQWIEWAYQNGDETYRRYTDDRPMYSPLVTYHKDKIGGVPTEVLDFKTEIDEEYFDDYTRSSNRKRYAAGDVQPLSIV